MSEPHRSHLLRVRRDQMQVAGINAGSRVDTCNYSWLKITLNAG